MRFLIYFVIVTAMFVAAVKAVGKWESQIEQRGYDRGMAEWAAAKVKEVQLARNEEARQQAEKVRIDNENKIEVEKAVATARNEHAAADQLRVRIRAIATAPGSAASRSTGIVFGGSAIERIAAVAGECVGEYQKLAEAARRAHLAGHACEASYDSLTLTLSKTIDPRPPPATTKSAVPNSNLSGDSK